MPELKVFPTEGALAEGAADLFITRGRDALRARGRFRAALSGGRGPRGLFKALAARPLALDWSKVELYWVDERWVPWEDSDSNYGELRRIWLDAWDQWPATFPMFNPGLGPEQAALAYERLVQTVSTEGPAFDLVLLGMGPDGHTASLFPGQASLQETSRKCLVVTQPSSGQTRLTLTLPVLNACPHCVFLLSGREKAGLLAEVLAGRSTVPASRIRIRQGDALWYADAAAAAMAQGA